MNDNRNYKYATDGYSNRMEYETVFEWVPKKSKVIDLGCGDGTLLYQLGKKGINGIGIDTSPSAISSAKKKKVKAIVGRIDKSLPYKNAEFDFSICNVTIQMVMYPEVLLSEMVRISKKQIISFPNFGFILNRLDFLLTGRMPKTTLHSYTWYNTGHIHQLGISDFKEYCLANNIMIIKQKNMYPKQLKKMAKSLDFFFPDLFALSAIFLLEK